MSGRLRDRAVATLATAALTRTLASALPPLVRRLPGGAARFERTNHRGEPVTLLEGPIAALGTAAGILATPSLTRAARMGGAVAAIGAGGFGALDDLAGSGADRGLRGHLSALRRGQVTTGAVKIAGLAATGLVAARVAGHRGVDAVLSGAVVAGTANLVNLFDLRPGRALKLVLLHAPALAARTEARTLLAASVGAALAVLADDLGERSMLGDTGANSLGAVVGLALAATPSRTIRFAQLAVLVAATLTSERVSFTELIAKTAPLRFLDELGRRPPQPLG